MNTLNRRRKKMSDNDKSIKPIDLPANIETTSIVMAAMQRGYEPAFIEKMMDLSERNEKNEARRQFFQAVADFKKDPPEVLKDKENSQFSKGEKKAMYVSLGRLISTVSPALGQHGLSASWEIGQAEKVVRVTCKLSHRLGHSESVTMEAPPDASGGNAKNPIQQIKSTVTYLRAATFEAVTGIAATEEANADDDGNGSGGPEYINEESVSNINSLLNETGADTAAFLKYIGSESVEKILVANYTKALVALNKKKKAAPMRQIGEEG
jgi:hypothetical protein